MKRGDRVVLVEHLAGDPYLNNPTADRLPGQTGVLAYQQSAWWRVTWDDGESSFMVHQRCLRVLPPDDTP